MHSKTDRDESSKSPKGLSPRSPKFIYIQAEMQFY